MNRDHTTRHRHTHGTITHPPQHAGIPMPTRLVYDTAEPHSIALIIKDQGHTVPWEVSRDTIRDALNGLLGGVGGDVTAWIAITGKFRVALTGDDAPPVEVEYDARVIADLLAESDHLVPPGCEFLMFDLDTELADLLSRGV